MEPEPQWAVTAGSAGLFFNPVGTHNATLPEWVDRITARLPDGRLVRPTRSASGVVFDPPLPDGSVVLVDGEHFYTVESTESFSP